MQAFTTLKGLVLPLDRPNVDTDAIIPKQYLKSIKRSGFGPNLFDDWRYLDAGEPGDDHSKRRLNPDFVMNLPRYQGASILLARENFGCGSSREHAPWALMDAGFYCVIAPSFADIFFNNCFKNGILPIVLKKDQIDNLFSQELDSQTQGNEGYQLSIDLSEQKVLTPAGEIYSFDVDESRKYRLLNGLDDIALTLKHADVIKQYETNLRESAPWLFQA